MSSPSLLEVKQPQLHTRRGNGEGVDGESTPATADFRHPDADCATVVEVLGKGDVYETSRNHTDAIGSVGSQHEDEAAHHSGQG